MFCHEIVSMVGTVAFEFQAKTIEWRETLNMKKGAFLFKTGSTRMQKKIIEIYIYIYIHNT